MITLYSTNCPRCKILEEKLQKKGIEFEVNSDVRELIDLGYRSAPILKIDNEFYDFGGAVKWVNAYAA
jgi:glutaredoxin